MPCNADTIVKIKVVIESVKENLVVVWAIGLYPVGVENCEIELTQFVPVNLEERDHDTQATFQKDEYFSISSKIVPDIYKNNIRPRMTVSTSTHLKILDRVPTSNKYSLKVSLVGIVQETSDFKNREDSVIKVSVTDYSRQDYNFVVNVVFQYLDSCFKGLASFIRPKETLVFIVGQIEFIENDIYVYAQDINCVNTYFNNKKREYDIKNEEIPSSTNSARSKLLSIHKDISKHAKKEPNDLLEKQLTNEKANILNNGINESLNNFEIDNELIEVKQNNKVVDKKINNKRCKKKGELNRKKDKEPSKFHNTRKSSGSNIIVIGNESE
ncbi:9194_t:CDS:2 [Scutellospora calospora]|uniref:9194_t:CDS:1 n=1 Tax=Scutellospora calospora TaxID=85575 RepID=A0ACA9KLR0_9GLOM|nr:9194_t:CDS:2 [Scutellospora calospora]